MQDKLNFSNTKGQQIKDFLIPYQQLSNALKRDLAEANSVSELWCLIFRHQLFAIYKDLVVAEFYPTALELNQVCVSQNKTTPYLNSWYWLTTLRGLSTANA